MRLFAWDQVLVNGDDQGSTLVGAKLACYVSAQLSLNHQMWYFKLGGCLEEDHNVYSLPQGFGGFIITSTIDPSHSISHTNLAQFSQQTSYSSAFQATSVANNTRGRGVCFILDCNRGENRFLFSP